MNNKGVSIVIGWVLLVGLSVALGMMVTTWIKQQAEDTTTFIIEDISGDTRCADVSLKAYIQATPCVINVSNSGYHTIFKVSARHQYGTQEFQVDLPPQQGSKSLNIGVSLEVDIIPVIQVDNKLLGCADRKVVLQC
jgi:hypothetical protein